MSVRNEITDLQRRIGLSIVGQEKIVESLVVGMLSNGNILVEGLPGLAKTRAIKALADNIEGDFNRIQFTPDITAGDIVGREVYYKAEDGELGSDGKVAGGMFRFVKGPVFANIVLADEVNRAPPRSQNSLLEAMEERQVTAAGKTHKVPDLFMVMATMNPSSQEGTFAMPEAQMDRFLLHVVVDYPDEEAEMGIIRLVRKEMSQAERSKTKAEKAPPVRTPQDVIFAARGEIDKITVPERVEKYMVDLIFATRYPQRYTYELKSFIKFGASPRASLALDRTARTHAWLNGQSEVGIENVQQMLKGVLRHRLIRGERAIEHRITTGDIVDELLELVKVPAA